MNIVNNFIEGLTSNVSGSVNISINFDSTQHAKTTTIRKAKQQFVLPVYMDNDSISGRIELELKNTNKFQHLGLRCYLIGLLQIYNDQSLNTQFTSTCKQLQPAGYLTINKIYQFKFSNFDKDYQSFIGLAGCVRYFIRVTLNRNIIGPLVEEEQFAVFKMSPQKSLSLTPIFLQVGVEERLHIQFNLIKNRYHIKEWVEGTIKFINVKMVVSKMEIAILRRQTLGTADSSSNKSKTLQRFEVMDGSPQQGDVIPIRIHLKGIQNMSPSYNSIHNRLFVRHWFSLIVVDDVGRRYFKQSQVTFYRK